MNWKQNLVTLGLAAAALAAIVGLESLAQTDSDSPIACYAGLAGDVTLLIGSPDSAPAAADCLAQIAVVERR